MVAFNGPAALKWRDIGQPSASITPPGGETAPVQNKAETFQKIVEAMAFLAAGGAIVYLIMTFSGDSSRRGDYR